MEERGRPTELDNPEIWQKIEEAALDGKSFEELSVLLGISYRTVRNWSYTNYQGFADKWDGWRRDRILALAERNIEEDMLMDTRVPVVTMAGILKDKDGKPVMKISAELRKIRASQSQFAAETLGSNTYSKKVKNENTEVTLEDLIDKAKKDRQNGRPSANDGDAFVDSEQETPGAEVSAQPGTEALPQQSDLGATAPNNNP